MIHQVAHGDPGLRQQNVSRKVSILKRNVGGEGKGQCPRECSRNAKSRHRNGPNQIAKLTGTANSFTGRNRLSHSLGIRTESAASCNELANFTLEANGSPT
jgi:hypothetical protein